MKQKIEKNINIKLLFIIINIYITFYKIIRIFINSFYRKKIIFL